jgi:O-antigen biosynthesis protein
MDIESTSTHLAGGRVYEKLVITGIAAGLTVAPYRSSEEGVSALPCKLFHLKGNEYVSVYPCLPIESARYAIGAFDENGNRVDSATHEITFKQAAKQAKKRSRRNSPDREEIALIDESLRETHTWGNIELVQLFGRPDHIQCRTIIELQGTTASHLRAAAYDQNLNLISDSYSILGEEPQKLADYLPNIGTSISVSFDIPWGAQDVFIVAWNDSTPDFFAQLFIPAKAWEDGTKASDTMLSDSASIAPDYDKWFKEHRITPYEMHAQKRCTFKTMPLFSIIVPLYKTPLDLFDEMLDSVLAQTYQNWECILVNSTPEDEALAARVATASSNDARVRAVTLEENLGISLNTNAGIAVAKGDFICFFDHDDTTEPDLLFEYVKEINVHPDTDVLYCDEDKLSEDGVYCDPVFKIDFSIDLLRNNNYFCHMLCIRKSLLDQLEPNTKELDGAQDHSLTLQAVEKCRKVGHAAKILYHWRKAAGSTAAGTEAKPYAVAAGVLGVQKHLQRVGLKGEVSSDNNQTIYKVEYAVPEGNPLVSIIVHSSDGPANLKRCIESIESKSTYDNYEIIVVIPAEERSTFESIAQLPRVKTVQLQSGCFDFAGAVNNGRAQATGDYLLLLGSEVEVVTPDWIERMLGNCARPEIGAVGIKLCYPDEIIYDAGIVIDDKPRHAYQGVPSEHWLPYYARLQRNVSAVPATCCMVSAEDFDAVCGFTGDFKHTFGDVDFCLKLQEQGKLIVYLPNAEAHCRIPLSRNRSIMHEAKTRRAQDLNLLKSRWSSIFANKDPYSSKGIARPFSGLVL